ncbi:MAG: ABC transporter permease [Candidatus Woesearchaeota archaeon]
MIRDYIKLAFTNLSHRKLRSWLTMIGIFIGIAAVVSLIGLGEGLRVAITSQFGFLGTDIMSVQAEGLNFGAPGTGAVKPLEDTLKDKIKNVNGVDTAFNRKIKQVTIDFNDKRNFGFAASVPLGKDKEVFYKMLNLKIDQGRFLKDNEPKSVLIGYGYSSKAVPSLGKTRFGKPLELGDTIVVNGKSYKVVGILSKKGSFIVDNILFFNEDSDIFPDDGTTSIIAIKVKDEKEIKKVKENVERVLRKERNVKVGEEDFRISTPEQALKSLNSALFAVQLFVYIIAGISLAVGGIGIMNTMYTAVLERTREIGIMKSIGARNSTIFFLFFIESGFLGMVGGLIGVLLGSGIAFGLAELGKMFLSSRLIRAEISLFLIIGSLMFSFILGTIFGLLPAYRASKLSPVEALRQ